MNALKQMLGRHQGQNVVAVSHRAVNKVLLCDLLGLGNSQFWAIRQDTCAINVIEHDEQHGFVIYRLNDTCHIRPLAELFAAPGQTADF
jgi:broad specificity phosphatase PhoE